MNQPLAIHSPALDVHEWLQRIKQVSGRGRLHDSPQHDMHVGIRQHVGVIRIGVLRAEFFREQVCARLLAADHGDEFIAGEGVDSGQYAIVCNLAGADESPTVSLHPRSTM